MTLPFILSVLLAASAPSPLCQPEPKESPAREATWNTRIARLPVLEKQLPQQPDTRLLMPVEGVRVSQVANTFGAARTDHLEHAGQDIFARRGTPVYSATGGVVWTIGSSEKGGTWVYVLGAGGRRYYYAHLAQVAPG